MKVLNLNVGNTYFRYVKTANEAMKCMFNYLKRYLITHYI